MTKLIEFYFDFSSPYAYLAPTKIEELAAKHGYTVQYKPMLLHPAFQVSGNISVALQPLKKDYVARDVPRLARYSGLPYRVPDNFPISSHVAARAFYVLNDQSGADAAVAFAKATFHAYFGEGRDIANPDVVAEVAANLGHDGVALIAATQAPEVKAKLKAETDAAIARGVFGAPFFFVDGEPFWGADRIWMIKYWIKDGGW